MKAKSVFIVIIVCLLNINVCAQEVKNEFRVIANEDSCNTESIQSAIDAYIMLVKSVESNDSLALLQAKYAMEECKLSDFTLLRSHNNEEESLNGHLVFSAEFADSLANGKDAYGNADMYNKREVVRGQTSSGRIFTRTCFVNAKGKSVYSFSSCGRQELAVVAEPGGRITTRVHAVNRFKGINEWHNDTADVAKGRNSRKTAFTLPNKPKTTVTLEIVNCTNKDISVVVISN